MEVKPGYKRTEIGHIPSDWDIRRLKHISPQQCVGVVVNPSTYFDTAGTVPFLVGSNVSENLIEWLTAKRITEVSNQRLAKSRLEADDIVMVRVGDPGVTAVVPQALDGCNCASMMIVRKHHSFDSRWLCAAMNSCRGRQQVSSVQYGTAQKQFNISDAVNFLYAFPPLPEQKAIAQALSDIDDLIQSLERLIAKKRDLKQAAMQQLLTGQTRLPGFSGESATTLLGDLCETYGDPPKEDGSVIEVAVTTQHMAMGAIPKGWRCETVGSVADLLTGFPFPSAGYSKSGIRLLRGSNVKRNAIEWGDGLTAYWPAATPDIQHYLLREDDIVIAMDGSLVGRSFASLSVDDVPALLLQRVARLRSTQVCQQYLAKWVCSKRFTAHCDAVKTTTAIPHISPSDIRSFQIAIPETSEEQKAIADVLSDMDAEIDALEARLAKTRDLKQGMMQELLTGRTRLV
jgi:type I restriction enzyme S subunit